MQKTLLVAVSAACLTSCVKNKDEKQPDLCSKEQYLNHPSNAVYQQELNNYKTINALPGAIIAIKKGNHPIWIGTTGKSDIDANVEMQPCTPFRIASITKVFTAVATLKLVEQGKLRLSDKVVSYLPELNGNIPHADQLTIRMLLNHSNGIIDPKNDLDEYKEDIQSDPEAIAAMSIDEKLARYVYGKELLFTPGTGYHYSNTGYWLLGKILEKVSHKNIQQIMDEVIFRPLNLKSTYYEKRTNPKLAHGYMIFNSALTDVTFYDGADGDADPSSGVVSTAADLVTFGEGLFAGKIIAPATLQEMTTSLKSPDCPNGDCEYGLGIETYQFGTNAGFGHNGMSFGFETNWIYFPQTKTTIVSLANKGGGTDKSFIGEVLK